MLKKLWAKLKSFFSRLGGIAETALHMAKARGLDHQLVAVALAWIRVAAVKYADNAQKREWVVHILVARGVSESVARLAVELAYQVWKQEFETQPVDTAAVMAKTGA